MEGIHETTNKEAGTLVEETEQTVAGIDEITGTWDDSNEWAVVLPTDEVEADSDKCTADGSTCRLGIIIVGVMCVMELLLNNYLEMHMMEYSAQCHLYDNRHAWKINTQ